MVIESSVEDFNSMLENNQDITLEERPILREIRRKGKNRLAAARSRDRRLSRQQAAVNDLDPIPGMVII